MPSPAQIQEEQRQQKERRERMKRLSKQPTDRHIPDELATVVIGDGVQRYERLREAERRLDALMMRKRLDVTDDLKHSASRRDGTLRIWISNTVEGQPWQVIEDGAGLNADGTFDFDNENNSATYSVKIEGRLLDDLNDESESTEAEAEDKPKFSSFFKSITVDFHRNPELEADGFAQIAWRKQQPIPQNPAVDLESAANSFDVLDFERKGDENINITINLVRDQKSERYRLSPPLADLLDTPEDDMSGIVQGIWEYARAMNLQEDEDKRTITCDEVLAKVSALHRRSDNVADDFIQVFNAPKIGFPFLPDLLKQHIQPLPPIKLKYTIRVDKAYISPTDSTPASQPTIYDIRVPLPSALPPILDKFRKHEAHIDSLKTIIDMDNDIALMVAKINQTNAKRKFFDNLSKDPAGFVQRWIGSQKRDLEVILAEATRGGGEDGEQWRKGGKDGVWGSDIARESVGLWLARSGR